MPTLNAASERDPARPVILFADIAVPENMKRVYGDHAPWNALRVYMSGILSTIGQHEGRTVTKTDGSAAVYFDTAEEAMRAAINIQRTTRQATAETGYALVIRIAIDHSWCDAETGLVAGEAETVGKVAKTQNGASILVSETIRSTARLAKVDFEEAGMKGPESASTRRFFKLLWNEDMEYPPAEATRNARFVYGGRLHDGEGAVCFYCGSRRHEATACPSKGIPEMQRGFHRLGYCTIGEINEAFGQYIAGGLMLDPSLSDRQGFGRQIDPILAAHLSLYELRAVFQLRFLNAIWDPPERYGNSWQRIRSSTNTPMSGGKLRLAADYLRASQLEQADETLKAIEWSNPKDFRFHCLSGFLAMERNSFSVAVHHFTKAYEHARTKAQKIYTLLLRYRILALDGKKRQAEETLRLCLSIDRTCPEVLFEDIVSKFDSDKPKEAIQLLIDLIGEHREYWVAAIICPDFAAFHDRIAPELENVLDKLRAEGTKLIDQAHTSMANLRQVIAEEDEEIRVLELRNGEIEELVLKNTYFGWHDSLRAASILASDCIRAERERRKRIEDIISVLKDRLFSVMQNPYARDGVSQKTIGAVREGINQAESALYELQPHKAILIDCSRLSERIDQMEKRLSEIEQRNRMMLRVRAFLKDSVIFLGIVAVLGVIITPLALGYLERVDYVADILSQTGVAWIYDTLAALAVFSSICFAVVRGILRGQKDERHVMPARR